MIANETTNNNDDFLNDPTLVDPDSGDVPFTCDLGEDLERFLTASVLQDSSVVAHAATLLKPKFFTHKAHRLALEIALEYHANYKAAIPDGKLPPEPTFPEEKK